MVYLTTRLCASLFIGLSGLTFWVHSVYPRAQFENSDADVSPEWHEPWDLVFWAVSDSGSVKLILMLRKTWQKGRTTGMWETQQSRGMEAGVCFHCYSLWSGTRHSAALWGPGSIWRFCGTCHIWLGSCLPPSNGAWPRGETQARVSRRRQQLPPWLKKQQNPLPIPPPCPNSHLCSFWTWRRSWCRKVVHGPHSAHEQCTCRLKGNRYTDSELIWVLMEILWGKNDINRTSFHIHCSLINPISYIKEKSKPTISSMEYKRPISTGNIKHVKNPSLLDHGLAGNA